MIKYALSRLLNCLAKCLFLYGDDLPQKLRAKSLQKNTKRLLPVDVSRLRTSLLARRRQEHLKAKRASLYFVNCMIKMWTDQITKWPQRHATWRLSFKKLKRAFNSYKKIMVQFCYFILHLKASRLFPVVYRYRWQGWIWIEIWKSWANFF